MSERTVQQEAEAIMFAQRVNIDVGQLAKSIDAYVERRVDEATKPLVEALKKSQEFWQRKDRGSEPFSTPHGSVQFASEGDVKAAIREALDEIEKKP